jgi:hypothetical protein
MPSAIETSDTSHPGLSWGRRVYAFFAVALAVFIVTVVIGGWIGRGYAFPNQAANTVEEPHFDPAQTEAELKATTAELDAARRKATEALDAYEFANAALVEFVSANLRELKRLEHGATSPVSNEAASIEAKPQQPINPRSQELHDQVRKLEDRRTELLVTLTSNHPTIRYIDLQLSDLNAQLKLIPEKIADGEKLAASQNAAPAAVAERKSNVILEWHKVDADYQRLRERQSTARQEYDAALAHETAAQKKHAAASARNLAAQTPPAKTQGAANPKMVVFLGVLFAAGIGCPIAARARKNEIAFRTAADVRQTLGIPVLGCLPRAPGESPREQPRREPTWVRRAVFAAELCVATTIVWIAVAGLADHQFFYDLLVNPLAACSQKFWC